MLLAAAVVGSGIMAQRLTSDVALALLANTFATVAVLAVLIAVFARGFDPSLVARERRVFAVCVDTPWSDGFSGSRAAAASHRDHHGPDILTFGSADSLTDLSARIEMNVAPEVSIDRRGLTVLDGPPPSEQRGPSKSLSTWVTERRR